MLQTNSIFIADERIYLNEDRTKALPEGHKDAKFLLIAKGHEIRREEAEKYDGALELLGEKKAPTKSDEASEKPKGKGK